MKLSSLRRGSLFYKKILKVRNKGIIYNKNENLLKGNSKICGSLQASRKKSNESFMQGETDTQIIPQVKDDRVRKIEKLKINELTNSEMYGKHLFLVRTL